MSRRDDTPSRPRSSTTTRRRALPRLLVVLLLFIAGFPPLYVALVPEQLPPPPALPEPPAGNYRVFVVDWGYHTAIVVEQPTGWRLGPPGAENAPFLEYAWGDRRFYYEGDHRPHVLLAALFLPTESVLYLDTHPDPPSFAGAEAVYTRTVDAATLRTLLAEAERVIRRAPDGARLPALAQAPGYRGRFYAAYGSYLWPRDCNWWVVARLAVAGLASAPTGVIFTTQVPARLRGFAAVRP
jgi:hypothetical protein